MELIIGLGNPDQKYERTRHNAGFMVLEAIQARLGFNWQTSKKLNARYARVGDTIYVMPLSYMNNSGQVVQAIMSYYKLLPKKLCLLKLKNADLSDTLTVIHDELDIDLGKHKTSVDSRAAGHNGIKSIINYLTTKNFTRIRIGIKTPAAANYPAEKFVLQRFSREELKILNPVISEVVESLVQ